MVGASENVKKLILEHLAKWKTTRVNKERLLDLKDEIIKRTGAKSLSLVNLKKWIHSTVKETKQAEKLRAIALAEPIAAPISARVYQQALVFDIAAMKRTVAKALDDLTRIKNIADKKPKDFRKNIAPQLAGTRKTLEDIEKRISEIERRLAIER